MPTNSQGDPIETAVLSYTDVYVCEQSLLTRRAYVSSLFMQLQAEAEKTTNKNGMTYKLIQDAIDQELFNLKQIDERLEMFAKMFPEHPRDWSEYIKYAAKMIKYVSED